jgi:cytochrome c5
VNHSPTIERAVKWLAKARPEFTAERAYQLLGLAWAGERAGKLKPLAEALLREQRDDGGWAQLPKLSSDAFATGQSLYALLQAGDIPANHPAVRRGVQFLLRTQLEDGTWYARRRAFPFQPPMDSGFPHGADGWLSASASSWAVMALATALDPAQAPKSTPALAKVEAAVPAIAAASTGSTTPPIQFSRDIQPLLERSCVACHSGERAKGGFQVTSREAFLKGGARGEPVVVAHRSAHSPLLRLITDQIEDQEMPPLGKRDKFPALSKDEAARLASWIDQGADWPTGVTLQPGSRP